MFVNLKKKNNGASMIEYILGLSILVISLYVIPVPGTGGGDCAPELNRKCNKGSGLSAIELLEQSLKVEYAKYSESIASPR